MYFAVNTLSAVTSNLKRDNSDPNLRSCSRHSFIFRAQNASSIFPANLPSYI
jgi:hypothetical protein